MEWFKHKTASHDDPDISDAIDEFGHFGYSGFFILAEIYGQEYSHIDKDGFLRFSWTFLKRKLRSSRTTVGQLLDYFQKKNRLTYKIEDDNIFINFPKFIELASNWTKRLPTEAPTEAPTAIEVEVEVEVEKKKKKKEIQSGFQPPSFLSDLWPDYLKTRTAKRAAKTDNALTGIVADLQKLAPDNQSKQFEILLQSIKNGYVGVFPLKVNNQVQQFRPVSQIKEGIHP